MRAKHVMSSNEIIGDRFVVKLVSEQLDINEAIEWVSDCQCGAISLFIGKTRQTESDDRSGRHVQSLDYEAYEPMALKEMKLIVEQCVGQSDELVKCFVAHRLGRVCCGQTSIVIACSSAHRTEAHRLVLSLLNDIKAKVPIWKTINYSINDSNDVKSEWSDKSEAFWL